MRKIKQIKQTKPRRKRAGTRRGSSPDLPGRVLSAVSSFFIFFLLVAFVITACLMLFIKTLQNTMGVQFTAEDISDAAKATMLNVILISVGFAVVDVLRRRFTVERPIKRITEATEKMIAGDFDVRVSAGVNGSLSEVADCINKMAEELSGVETLRTDFIANVSHEMKTPLSVIQSYATLLEEPDLDEATRVEYAHIVTDASRRLSDMMTNILKLNRLENQQIYPQAETYDLGEQLCECILQYESVWESRSIELETALAEDIRICADRELLSLVWNNLLSNAFKFTEAGGRVSVALFAEEENAVVQVRDSGCGMSPEVGAHIFEKFYQGDPARATQGNGLGLALVKRVVDILNAEISVESAVGVGTTFMVKLRGQTDGLEKDR